MGLKLQWINFNKPPPVPPCYDAMTDLGDGPRSHVTDPNGFSVVSPRRRRLPLTTGHNDSSFCIHHFSRFYRYVLIQILPSYSLYSLVPPRHDRSGICPVVHSLTLTEFHILSKVARLIGAALRPSFRLPSCSDRPTGDRRLTGSLSFHLETDRRDGDRQRERTPRRSFTENTLICAAR